MLPCHFLGDVPSGQETQALGKGRLLQRSGAGLLHDGHGGGDDSDGTHNDSDENTLKRKDYFKEPEQTKVFISDICRTHLTQNFLESEGEVGNRAKDLT